jgi:hypothetical protein
MTEIRLIIKCAKHKDHQKILRFDAAIGLAAVGTVAAILDGTSPHYIHRPQEGSPIGKCVICREPITTEIVELVVTKRRPQEYHDAIAH